MAMSRPLRPCLNHHRPTTRGQRSLTDAADGYTCTSAAAHLPTWLGLSELGRASPAGSRQERVERAARGGCYGCGHDRACGLAPCSDPARMAAVYPRPRAVGVGQRSSTRRLPRCGLVRGTDLWVRDVHRVWPVSVAHAWPEQGIPSRGGGLGTGDRATAARQGALGRRATYRRTLSGRPPAFIKP